MKAWMVSCAALVMFFVVLSAPLCGQTVSTSQVTGTIKDPTGATVPGADVQLIETDTGVVHKVKSNASGEYLIPDLESGKYNLQVSFSGFQTYIQENIVLNVGSNPQINVGLTVGSVTERVEVEAANASVEMASTGIGQVIDEKQVIELPLNGRDPDQLIALAGVTTTAVNGDLNSNKNFPTIAISVAGGLPNAVAFVLDGGSHNEPTNGLNLPQPMPDSLQEFKVETSSLPAQYGDHASAAINAVTKSGGNKFHGTAFEYIRNYLFNAQNFFSSSALTPYKDGLKRNQFGGTFGGPILKSKLFFFGGFEDTIVRAVPTSSYTQVPTTAMMNGDFSTVTSTQCNKSAITLGAPFTTIGGVPNQLPSGSTSQQALKAMQYIPIAGSSSAPDVTAVATKGQYTAACGYVNVKVPGNSRQDNVIGRVDWVRSDRHRIFARYFLGINDQPIPATPNNALTENAVFQYNRDQGITVGDTFSFTPNFINALRLTANRVVNLRVVDPFFDPSTLGINTYNAIPGYTALSVTNGFTVGGGTTNPGHFNSTELQLVNDVSYIRGSHAIGAGVDYIYALMNTVNNRPANGTYTFSGQALSSNGSYGYADFFAGTVDTFTQGLPDLENDGQQRVGLYAQDAWRVNSRLTINYGLRWEPYIPEHNSNGHVENFSMSAFTAGQKSNVFTSAPAGLLFQGDPGMPGNHYNYGSYANFDPRIGAILDPFGDGKTSVRASFGLFHDSPQMFFTTRFSNSPPFGDTISLNNVSFANPWASYPGGDPFPGLDTLSTTAPFAQEGVYVNVPLHLKEMYLEQWNLSLQRQVGTWLFGASYLGNRTVHLPTGNEADPALYIAGTSTGVAGSCGTLSGSNLPASGKACSSTSNYNARRLLYQQNPSQGLYYSTIGTLDDGGNANYNATLLSVQRRAKLMNIVANFTWAHCLSEAETTELTGPTYEIPQAVNGNGRSFSYSNCDSDRRKVANISTILTAPSLQNKKLKMFLSGWQWSTIFTATSGGYTTASTGVDTMLLGTGSAYAIDPASPYGARSNFGVQGYLVPAANWGVPTTGQIDTQHPLTIVGPSSYELDMSLVRTFPIYHHDSQNIQFRWEVFNVPNEAIFTTLSTTTTSSTFGNFTASGNPRIMQFAGRYVF